MATCLRRRARRTAARRARRNRTEAPIVRRQEYRAFNSLDGISQVKNKAPHSSDARRHFRADPVSTRRTDIAIDIVAVIPQQFAAAAASIAAIGSALVAVLPVLLEHPAVSALVSRVLGQMALNFANGRATAVAFASGNAAPAPAPFTPSPKS